MTVSGAGQVPPPKLITDHPTLKPKAKLSTYVFLCGVALVVLFGFFRSASRSGIPPQFLIAMFPSVNGYFFIPTYGSLIAAINFDLSGTMRIGRYVLNHSFMIPGLVATAVAVTSGLLIAQAIRCRLLRPDARRSHVAGQWRKLSLSVDPERGARWAIRDTGVGRPDRDHLLSLLRGAPAPGE